MSMYDYDNDGRRIGGRSSGNRAGASMNDGAGGLQYGNERASGYGGYQVSPGQYDDFGSTLQNDDDDDDYNHQIHTRDHSTW